MTEDKKTEPKKEEPKKPEPPKTVVVRVVRAVDGYHSRNSVITVPNDPYHKGLIRLGNLALVKGA